MRAISLLLAFSALTVAAVPLAAAASAPVPCSGGACDAINRLCGDCLPAASAETQRCMGEVCDAINVVCLKLFGVRCVG